MQAVALGQDKCPCSSSCHPCRGHRESWGCHCPSAGVNSFCPAPGAALGTARGWWQELQGQGQPSAVPGLLQAWELCLEPAQC